MSTNDAGGFFPDESPRWARGRGAEGGLRRFLTIARERWPVMLALLGLVIAAALLATTLSAKRYESEALLSVSPVSTGDSTFDGTNVIRETGVPGRDVETLARLVTTAPMTKAAAETLGDGWTPGKVLSKVTVSPIGGSFLVSVKAEGASAQQAADVANALAKATVSVRSAQFRDQVAAQITQINSQLANSAALRESAKEQLQTRLGQLEALAGSSDPSLQLSTSATPPAGASSPGLSLVLPIALVVGLFVAFAGALALDTMSTRVRTDSQVEQVFDLPVLARVGKPSGGEPPAYTDLAHSLAALRRDGSRPLSVLFTSPGDNENRTTASVEAAKSLAEAGQRVLMVETDLRRPSLARRLGITAANGTGAVVLGHTPLSEAAVSVPGFDGALRVLSGADRYASAASIAMSPAMVSGLLSSVRSADFVIFDGAPLGTVLDAVPTATSVDGVVIVLRRGVSEVADVKNLSGVLQREGVTPLGLCLTDWPGGERTRRIDDVAVPTAAPRGRAEPPRTGGATTTAATPTSGEARAARRTRGSAGTRS